MKFSKVSALVSLVIGGVGMSAAARAATIAQYNFDTATYSTDTNLTTSPDNTNNGFDVTWGGQQALAVNDNPFGQPGDNSLGVIYAPGSAAKNDSLNLQGDGSSDFTIEGWMKPLSLVPTRVYIAFLDNNANKPTVALGMVNGNAYARFTSGSNTTTVTSTDTLVVGKWNYLAYVYDGSTIHLYVLNSNHPTLTEVGSQNASITLSTGFSTYAQIATNNTAGAANSVLYDDIRISDTALNDADLGYHASFSVVPEPATLAFLGMGGLLIMRRRRVWPA